MNRLIHGLVGAGLAAVALIARAEEFPDGATTPTAAEIKQYVDGKVFNVKNADGNTWHMEYKSDGTLVVEPARGPNYNGYWAYEDGKLCDQPRGKVKGCNDVRMHQGVLHLKRNNGQIILFTP